MRYMIECIRSDTSSDAVYLWKLCPYQDHKKTCVDAFRSAIAGHVRTLLIRLHWVGIQKGVLRLSCRCPLGTPCRRDWLYWMLKSEQNELTIALPTYEAQWPYRGIPEELNSAYPWDFDRPSTTPILLHPDLVYVFGSNTAGIHGKGAALEALTWYGARYGQGEGLMGQSYGIPTKDAKLHVLPLSTIYDAIERFLAWRESSGRVCYVTPVGCGLAGYLPAKIAPLFNGLRHAWVPDCWYPFLL